jgi:hypothetical protein
MGGIIWEAAKEIPSVRESVAGKKYSIANNNEYQSATIQEKSLALPWKLSPYLLSSP